MKQSLAIKSKYLVFAALFLMLVSSLFGCGGSDGTNGINGKDTSGFVKVGELTTDQWHSLSLKGEVTSVTIASPPVVKFKVTDNFGHPVIGLGNTSKSSTATVPGLTQLGFTLAKLVPGTNGSPSKWVSYIVTSPPTTTNAAVTATRPTTDAQGTLVDNGDGTYQYTFYRDITQVKSVIDGTTDSGNNKKADLGDLTYEPTKTHRLGIQVGGYARGTGSNTADGVTVVPEVRINDAANIIYDFIPATGQKVTAADASREIVLMSNCLECHIKFDIHGGNRQDPRYCVTCHSDQRKFGRAEATTTATGYSGDTYKINNEAVGDFIPFIHRMHKGEKLTKTGYNYAAILFNEIKYPQDIRNCMKCHKASAAAPQGDNWKTVPSRRACGACHDNVNFATGANHAGGIRLDDSQCAGCHTAADIVAKHNTPVDTLNNPGAPAGLAVISYELSSVTVNASNQAVFKFRIIKDGTPVTLNAASAAVPLAGFTNGPSFYVAYSVPQQGIANPADFNAGNAGAIGTSATNVTLLNVWNGTQGTLSARDADGFYTATIGGGTLPNVNAIIPAGTKTITGVIIGSFNQDGVTEASMGVDFNGDGDLLDAFPIVAHAVYKTVTGTGFTPRRQIVSDNSCDKCHEQLGTEPSFHTGARSNAEMCAICHNPNRNSSSWSSSSREFIHSIHAANTSNPFVPATGKRDNKYGWHADLEYWKVTYPTNPKRCEACHLPGTYDFSASQYTPDLLSRLLPATASSSNVTALAPQSSPLLTLGDYSDVGTDKSANLVNSPLSSPCFGCHDSSVAVAHMRTNGGQLYVPRRNYVAGTEQCLVCHGSGKVADIKVVHQGGDVVLH
ncbi:MAG: OmcA/MtrC family decaheme c-type cytochrome [Thermodesulfovibrionales bacterium]